MNEALPFTSVTTKHGYGNAGVVKINNIPFTVTGQEIARFISQYIKEPQTVAKEKLRGPIHIIMEKPTGKTMDCFVEFRTPEAARHCVQQFDYGIEPGKNMKIGNRNVSLDLSDQAELRKAIFPRSRYVDFDKSTGKPRIMSHEEDPSWSEGFRGYMTEEEIYGITRFAENPARSPFVLKCKQRVYESMVSTLYKFPWAATQTYTVAARDTLFRTAHKLLSILSQKVFAPNDATGRYQREVGLSWALLHDLTYTSIRAPFSLSQKAALLRASGPFGDTVREVPWFAASWPFQTIVPRANVNDDVLECWLELFNSGYEVMQEELQTNPHERYMFVRCNVDGLPVTEWTDQGLMLSMEAGIRMEFDVIMTYIDRARNVPPADRELQDEEWESRAFLKLMNLIAEEKGAGQTIARESPSRKNSSISPTTTGFDLQIDLVDDVSVPARTDVTSQPGFINTDQVPSQKLNPATSKDFVPATTPISSNTTAPAVNNALDTIKSIWNYPIEPAVIDATTSNTSKRSASHITLADARPVLRNPFATDSTKHQVFNQDALAVDAPTPFWRESVNPFQRKKQNGSNMTSLPSGSSYETPRRGSNLQDLFIAQRDSTPLISDSVRQLSLETASRNSSTDKATTTANTSLSSVYRKLSTTDNEHGSPAKTFVQKYANLTYSRMRQNHVRNQTGQDQHLSRTSSVQGRIHDRVMSTASFSGPTRHSSFVTKARAHSTPFGAIGEPISGDVYTRFSHGDREDNRPVGLAATSVRGYDETPASTRISLDNVDFNFNSNARLGGRQGRLSAGELWEGLSGSK